MNDEYTMANYKCKFPLKEWEDSINKMSYGELRKIIEDPDIYNPSYLELAKKKMEELSTIPENEVMKSRIIESLKELGCPCEMNEDGDLDFWFRGGHFFIILKEENHYIEICDYCWKTVSLDDTKEVERLKNAVNYANMMSNVSTVYFIDDDEQYIGVYCTTSILYRPTITDITDYLSIRLHNFFLAHDLVNSEMILMSERDIKEQKDELDYLNVDKYSVS